VNHLAHRIPPPEAELPAGWGGSSLAPSTLVTTFSRLVTVLRNRRAARVRGRSHSTVVRHLRTNLQERAGSSVGPARSISSSAPGVAMTVSMRSATTSLSFLTIVSRMTVPGRNSIRVRRCPRLTSSPCLPMMAQPRFRFLSCTALQETRENTASS
jgi:hypothetical protein